MTYNPDILTLYTRIEHLEKRVTTLQSQIVGPVASHDLISVASKATQFVASYFGITRCDLQGPSRLQHLVWARSIAMHLIKNHTTLTPTQIGSIFDRSPGTVNLAIASVAIRTQTEPKSQAVQQLAEIETQFATLL
jgi:chromosomal replication initiation ATPase DnaA